MKILSVKLKSVITGAVLIIITLLILITTNALAETVSGKMRLIPIYNVDTQESKVAVTFNCAMSGDIDRIIEILDSYEIRCTFFMLGYWAEAHPEEVKAIYTAGHEIGNHGYSHKDLPSMSSESVILDIQQCNETIKTITGHSPALFRAPSGSYDNKTISSAEELGMKTIQWDVEPPATVGTGYV